MRSGDDTNLRLSSRSCVIHRALEVITHTFGGRLLRIGLELVLGLVPERLAEVVRHVVW